MKRTSLASLVAVLVMAGMACGQITTTVWNPAGQGIYPPDTGNWNDPFNWTINSVPDDTNKVVFNVADAAETIVNDAQSVFKFSQGDNGPGGVIRVQAGGSITTTGDADWSAIGYNDTAHMIVETGGSVTTAFRLSLAREGESTLDINGGTVTTLGDGDLDFGSSGGTGIVNINDGGVLNTGRDLDFDNGFGEVNVNAGGVLNAGRDVDWDGGIGQVNINAGGEVNARRVDLESGDPGQFNVYEGGNLNINQLFDDGHLFVADGGQVTTEENWSSVGRNGTGTLTVEGKVDFGNHLWVGMNVGATGTVDINGGTVTVGGMIGLGWSGGVDPKGTGFVNVNEGGLLALSNIHSDTENLYSIREGSLLNITGTGQVTLPGNFEAVIEAYVAAGRIIADGGTGTVQIEVVAGPADGDYNGNGQVEQSDLDLVLLNWGDPFVPAPVGWVNDLPTPDTIDQDELDGVLLNWGNEGGESVTIVTASSPGAAAVPEPSTLTLLLASAFVLCGLGRRRSG